MHTTTSSLSTGETLLAAALEHVESASIRAWAMTEHNRPLFLQLAQKALDKSGPSADPHLFAAYIVATAIGL